MVATMSKLDDLIKQYCPDGVEYKPLSEIFDFRNGYTPSKSNPEFWENGAIPWFRLEDIRENGRILSEAIQHVSAEAAKGDIFPADSFIVSTSATIGEHAWITVPFLANQRFTCLTSKAEWESRLDSKYIYYALFNLDKWCKENIRIGNFASVDMNGFAKWRFPVPPKEVQVEIATILDNFTKLTAELTAELTARRAQYEYYRDKLLTFDDETAIVKRIKDMLDQSCGGPEKVEYKKLCDVGSFRRGGNFQKKEMVQCGVPCIHYGQIYMHYGLVAKDTISFLSEDVACNQKTANPGEVIIAITSENVEDVCKAVVWEGETPVCISGHTAVFNTSMNPRFVAYWFQTEMFQAQKRKYAHGVKVIEISPDQVGQCRIPCPPRSVQNEIISILDKFNKLTTDISTGLPAEISLRQKQYEHYRDRLLNFNGGGMP